MLSHFLLIFFSVVTWFHNESVFPAANLYDVCSELLINKQLQHKLDVKSQQLTKIAAFLESAEIQDVVSKHDRKIMPLVEQRLLLDGNIDSKLVTILSKDQRESLRTLYLSVKFPFPYSPFESSEVLAFCNVSDVDRKEIIDVVEKVRKRTLKSVVELRQNAVKEIVALLPAKSVNGFVHYAGRKYFPNHQLNRNIPSIAIPFPKTSRSVFSLAKLSSGELKTVLELSNEQAESLMRMSEGVASRLLVAPGENNVLRDTSNDMLAVLNDNQRAIAMAELTRLAFEEDFVTPFETPEFTKFLELTHEEVDAFRIVVLDESKLLNENILDVNRRTFQQLVAALPEHSRAKMNSNFGGIWKQ